MLLANQKLSDSPLLPSDQETVRAQRTWLLLNVLIMTWAVFGVFNWIEGNFEATRVCAIAFFVNLTILIFLRKSQNYELIIHSYLTASAVGLCFISVSHPDAAQAIYFFPVAILVCSYLFGVKQAFIWLIISLHLFVFCHYLQYGITEAFREHLV
ncbi:hypothetical protein N9Y42_07560 [Mariniblastus sp.]|nr:hypothetical protein [Mariniblastus sp.]